MYPDHNIRRIPSSRNTTDERLDPTRFATQSQNLKLLYVDEIFCNMLFLVAGALESDTPELRSVLRPSTIRRHVRHTRRMFLSTQRLSASAAGKMVSTYTKFRVTHTAMENPKILSAGIIDARSDANEHALARRDKHRAPRLERLRQGHRVLLRRGRELMPILALRWS